MKSPAVCFPPGLLLNVRKIRVEPDNKRLALCTNTALNSIQKDKINEYIKKSNNTEFA